MLVEVVIVLFCLIPHVVASEGNTTIQQLPFRLLGFNPCWLWSQISLVVCVCIVTKYRQCVHLQMANTNIEHNTNKSNVIIIKKRVKYSMAIVIPPAPFLFQMKF